LTQEFSWRGRRVRWERRGTGPAVVFCHGTPWSSWLWAPYASALSDRFSTYLWDMPGYGQSSKDPEHSVALGVQGELLHDLLEHWELEAAHIVAHDYGGTVALRAHLLHGTRVASLALVDVVAVRPWGSDFLRLVRDNVDVFAALPPAMHEGAVRAYIRGASHAGLTEEDLDALVAPWLGPTGQTALYRQMAEADEAYTDEIEPLYPSIAVPTLVVWGREDSWLPAAQADQLAAVIPGAQLELVDGAGHLIQLDQPIPLATHLRDWLTVQTPATQGVHRGQDRST
jgi:pimeloyl-ACP methyl ester carboxylesterase